MTERGKYRVCGALAGTVNGLFGGGGGIPLVFLLRSWAKLSDKTALATCVAVIFPFCLVSVLVYAFRGALPNGWLNMDFIRTCSYSPKLYEISRYYKTFSHILEVRTVSAEYLIAMKMRAGRRYKNDVSDIIGILGEHENSGTPITMERIDMAVKTLYGGWDSIDPWLKLYVEQAMTEKNYSEKYQETRQTEMKSKELLVGFQQDYPDVLNDENANKIAESLGSASAKRKEKRASVIEKLRSPASQDNSNTKKRDNGMEHDR